MNKEQVWLAMSYSWSEIGLNSREYGVFAEKIAAKPDEIGEIRKVVFWEVCGAFAVFTIFALLTMGMVLPDWGFKDEYTLEKVSRWMRRPLLLSLLNPLWLVGYPLACLFAIGGWKMLSKSIKNIEINAE